MNIIKDLTRRIEECRVDNKEPCKNYASEANAEKATAAMAQEAARYFTRPGEDVRSANYVVFYVESWGRWVGCINLSEVISRKSSTGGYLGICTGFFTW